MRSRCVVVGYEKPICGGVSPHGGNPPPHLASGYFLSGFGVSQQLDGDGEQRRQQRLLLVGGSELDEQRS